MRRLQNADAFLRLPGDGNNGHLDRRQLRRIVEPDVDHFGFAGEQRAMLVGMAADRHHVIEAQTGELFDGF